MIYIYFFDLNTLLFQFYFFYFPDLVISYIVYIYFFDLNTLFLTQQSIFNPNYIFFYIFVHVHMYCAPIRIDARACDNGFISVCKLLFFVCG